MSLQHWVVGFVFVASGVNAGRSAQARPAHPGQHRTGGEFEESQQRLVPDQYAEQAGTSTTGLRLADVDDDGDLDLFIAEGTASLDPRPNVLLINDGEGTFSNESAARLPQGMDANSTRVEFSDVDGDTDLDAIVANLGPEQLLLNDGAGYFVDGAAQLPSPVSLFEDISANAQFADVDGDGCLDLLISNENPFDPSPTRGAQNRLWMNDCTGAFSDETAQRLPAITDQTAAQLAGDVDRDGDADIVVLNRGQEFVFINDGNGVFSDETAARFPPTSDSTRSGALVDFDRDGALDLVTSNSRGEAPRYYVNDGNGVFSEREFGYPGAADETLSELLVVDVDHDRWPDIYIANAGAFDSGHGFAGGADLLFRNVGYGFRKVTRYGTFPVGQASTAATWGDLNDDGLGDLVVAGSGDGDLGRERIFLRQYAGCRK